MGNIEATPTVCEFDGFEASTDCERLNNAMDGAGTNEEVIIRIITRRTTFQRQILKESYKSMFGDNLVDRLKEELQGDFEEAILTLMALNPVSDARKLRRAMVGPGTDDRILIEILCTKSNEKLEAIRTAYTEMYERSLVDDLRDETSGDFKHLLLALINGNRDELFEVDEDAAQADAQAIYDAGEGRWYGTDEDEFTKILATRSYLQLRIIFEKYAEIAGNSFREAVESETSGNLCDSYLTIIDIVEDHLAYYAKKLHEAMRGLGTDEDALTRIIIGRSEIDLGAIQDKYEEMYGNPLWQDINDECSSDYKRLLLNILRD